MQLLKPLCIRHIGFASANAPHVAGVDQTDLDARILQDLVDGNPVVAGAFDGNGLDAALLKPSAHFVEVACETSERADELDIALFWHGHHEFLGGHVNARSIWIGDPLEQTCVRFLRCFFFFFTGIDTSLIMVNVSARTGASDETK
jgi:hypothetical protein